MADLKTGYRACTRRQESKVFLFILTDSQVTNDKFLVYINDILSSGWIPELFTKDKIDSILWKVRAKTKNAGYIDRSDQLFNFFLDKARKNLSLALYSPH